MTPAVRRAQYDCDITYVTNSELGFDYLRDNLAMMADEVVITRPFNFCVIDEADSILIDEARTPLIISGKIDAPARKYQNANRIAVVLERDLHYEVDEKQQGVTLTERGQVDCEQALGGRDLFSTKDPWINFILNAIKAKELFKKEVNYIIDNNEVSGSWIYHNAGRRKPAFNSPFFVFPRGEDAENTSVLLMRLWADRYHR